MPDQQFPQTKRSRPTNVGGGRRWLITAVVGIAAALLIAMVTAGRLQEPPAPQPTPPPPVVAGDRLYLVNAQLNLRTLLTDSHLSVYGAQDHALIYTLPGVVAAELAPDGRTLFAIDSTSLRAVEAASGHELWRTPLSNVAGQEGYGPSPLAVSPDGQTIVVLRATESLPYGGPLTYSLQRIDAAAGAIRDANIPVFADAYFARMHLSPDGATVYLVIPLKPVMAINLDNRQVRQGPPLAHATGDALLSADGELLLVVEQVDQQVRLVVLDTASWQQLRSVQLTAPDQPFEVSGGGIAPLADGERIAIGLNQVEINPGGPAGAVSYSGGQIRIYSQQTWEETARLEFRSSLAAFTFASSRRETTIYAAADGSSDILAYHPDASQTVEEGELPEMIIRTLLVGPAFPAQHPVVSVSPPEERLPEHVVPLSATNQPGSSETLAWIWQPDPFINEGGEADLIAVGGDGQQTVIEQRVQALAHRRGQPPLLVVPDSRERSVIVDPVSGSRVPLAIAAGSEPHEALLAPDGAELILKTRQDPFPDDEYRATTQLVRCATATGSCQRVVDWTSSPLLLSSQAAAWVDQRVFFSPTSNIGSIWYLDLRSAKPEPTSVFTLSMNVTTEQPQLDRERQRMIYIAHQPGPDFTSSYLSRTLMLYDLQTGTETVLMEDIGWGQLALAPDGRSLAQLREGDRTGPELVVTNLVRGVEQRLSYGLHSANNQLYWSADSRWLLMTFRDPGLQAQGAQRLLIWEVPEGRLAQQIPIPRSWQVGSWQSDFDVMGPQTYLTEEWLVAVAYDQGSHLITVDLRPGVERKVGYLKLPEPGMRVVYVP